MVRLSVVLFELERRIEGGERVVPAPEDVQRGAAVGVDRVRGGPPGQHIVVQSQRFFSLPLHHQCVRIADLQRTRRRQEHMQQSAFGSAP